MMPVKILFVVSDFAVGGGQTLLIDLFRRFNPALITPVVVALARPGLSEKRLPSHINVLHFIRRWKFDMRPAAGLADLITRENIQTLFVVNLFSYLLVRLALRRVRHRVRLFLSLHSTVPRSFKAYLQDILSTRLFKGDEVLLTVCHNQARYISETYHVPARQFTTIYNGVDPTHWTLPPSGFDRDKFLAGYDVPPDAPVILLVAMFRREKRLSDAIRALAVLRGRMRHMPYLFLVGGGTDEAEQELRTLAGVLDVAPYVKFCGLHSDVRPFYWSASLFTLSSISIETFSIAALEAMASGLPCVLTDLGGANEMIEEGFNGFVVPPGRPDRLAEAWKAVLLHPARYPAAAIRARVIERFAIDDCVTAYEQVLCETK